MGNLVLVSARWRSVTCNLESLYYVIMNSSFEFFFFFKFKVLPLISTFIGTGNTHHTHHTHIFFLFYFSPVLVSSWTPERLMARHRANRNREKKSQKQKHVELKEFIIFVEREIEGEKKGTAGIMDIHTNTSERGVGQES